MKKILVILTSILLCGIMVGCSSSVPSVAFSGRKAWQFTANYNRNNERIVYSATRNSHTLIEKTAYAAGELAFNLTEMGDGTATLTTDLSLLHNENSLFNGETDTINSTVSFSASSLLPIASNKTISRATSEGYKGYTSENDYEERTTIITPTSDGIANENAQKSYRLKSSGYFDNEQIYHLVRAIPNIKAGSTSTFSLVTAYDIYANDKFFTHTIKATVDTNLVRLEVPKNIYDIAIPRSSGDPGKLLNDGKYEIDCLAVTIRLDAEKSGPYFTMYLSDLNFIDNEFIRENQDIHPNSFTSRVPIKIVIFEYSLTTQVSASLEFNILSYSTI